MPGERINLRHLYCFCEVARQQSVSGASQQVHLSQPAITQAISRLERDLDVRLFDRRSSGMYLTEHGDTYFARAERALGYLETGANAALRVAQKSRSKGFTSFHRLTTASQLRALIAVVETGNFSLAARASGISQPSIHRGARDLERLAGVQLFARTSLGIQPTRAARILARHAKLAFAEIAHARSEVDAMRGLDTGQIAIGAMPLARAYVLPRALTELTKLYPEHRIRIVDGRYEHLLEGLRQGELDLLIGALRDPAPIEDVVQTPLFEDPLMIVVRAGHPLTLERDAGAARLAEFPWIAPPPGTPLRQRFEALFAEAGIAPPARFVECGSVMATRGLLLESDRACLLSPHQVHYELAAGLLAALPHPLGHVARPICVTTRRDWSPTPALRRLMTILQEDSGQGAAAINAPIE